MCDQPSGFSNKMANPGDAGFPRVLRGGCILGDILCRVLCCAQGGGQQCVGMGGVRVERGAASERILLVIEDG